MRPIIRSVAPPHPIRPHAAPARAYGEPTAERREYAARPPAASSRIESRQDVHVSVRVFDHGGSAVVARAEDGRIDAIVR